MFLKNIKKTLHKVDQLVLNLRKQKKSIQKQDSTYDPIFIYLLHCTLVSCLAIQPS